MIIFTITKILSALIMPLSIGLILGLLGLWYMYQNHIKKAKIFLTISLIWIAIISYTPFANMLLKPLETQYSRLTTIPKDVHYILLLGGDRKNRAWEAIRLYHQISNAKIITSGYAPNGGTPSAIKTAKLLEESGVKKEDILIQPKPRYTQEEAIAIKKRLGNKPFILVTSAYHMPRAMKIFKKIGLNPIPAPTDFRIRNINEFYTYPKGKRLLFTEQAWHEYLGLLWLKLKN